ncbi:MAG: hypothetical protein WC711_01930 [Candidatus Staskawiczbacteria bacterium]
MKTKYAKQKIITNAEQCSRCAAEFEIWLSNSRVSEDKKEKMASRLLIHCPACSRADEN